MKRLFGAFALVFVAWLFLQFHESSPNDQIDTAWVFMIALVFGTASLVMIIGTGKWSCRAMGLLLTSIGTALLYGSVWWQRVIAGSGKQTPEWIVDLFRSFYIIGGPFLAGGLVAWVWARWRYPRPHIELPGQLDPEL